MLNPYGYDVEVWKCSAESQDVGEPSFHVIQEAKPTVRQLTASAAAMGKYGTSSSRVQFLPWAHIRAAPRHATRFSFPFLAGITLGDIHIWDVRTGALVQSMLNIQPNVNEGVPHLRAISDINLTERYVFVCGSRLRVFDRSFREVVGVGREPALQVEDIAPQSVFGKWSFTVATDDSGEVIQKPHIEGALVVEHETVLVGPKYEGDEGFFAGEYLDVVASVVSHVEPGPPIITVYVSSCGSHVAILPFGSKILVKPYFKDGYAGRIPSEWNMFEIDLSPFNPNFDNDDFDHIVFGNGRIAVPVV